MHGINIRPKRNVQCSFLTLFKKKVFLVVKTLQKGLLNTEVNYF